MPRRVRQRASKRSRVVAADGEDGEDVGGANDEVKARESARTEPRAVPGRDIDSDGPQPTSVERKHGSGAPQEVGGGGTAEAKAREEGEEKEEEGKGKKGSDPRDTITINRAPVLTLWVAVVAEHLGASRGTAATIGRAIATLFARSKGRAIGALAEHDSAQDSEEERKAPPEPHPRTEHFRIMGRTVPLVSTKLGVCALQNGRPITHKQAEGYLDRNFKAAQGRVRKAMQRLVDKFGADHDALSQKAYKLYTQFRPMVAPGMGGWAQKTKLHLELIRKLGPLSKEAKQRRRNNFFKKRKTG